jgi:hypothetical protein
MKQEGFFYEQDHFFRLHVVDVADPYESTLEPLWVFFSKPSQMVAIVAVGATAF